MRILHTSDWHLGQHFFGKSRQAEHQALINWLFSTIEQQNIDTVIIAGDIFDTGTPPSYARSLLNELVVGLHQRQCHLVLIAGNHDSVAVLNENKALWQHLNCHLVTTPSETLTEQLIPITKKDEVVGVIAAVPFLRPKDIQQSQPGEDQQHKQLQLQQAITEHYQQLFSEAKHYLDQQSIHSLPIVMTGHFTVLGGKSSDSVRDIYIGSLSGFDAKLLPPADYIALGHIHRASQIGDKAIYYSGSPIPLSFDELKQAKQMNVISFDDEHALSVQNITVPMFQPMLALTCKLMEITDKLDGYLSENTLEPEQSLWLSLTIEQPSLTGDLTTQVQQLLAEYHVELLCLSIIEHKTETRFHHTQQSLKQLTPDEVFATLIAQKQLSTPESEQQVQQENHSAERVKSLFSEIYQQVITE